MKSLNADGYDTHGTSQPETDMSQTANSRTWLRLRLPCWTAQQHNQLSTLFPFRFRSWEDSNKMYNKEVSLQCSQFKYEPSTKKDRKASLGNKPNILTPTVKQTKDKKRKWKQLTRVSPIQSGGSKEIHVTLSFLLKSSSLWKQAVTI